MGIISIILCFLVIVSGGNWGGNRNWVECWFVFRGFRGYGVMVFVRFVVRFFVFV